jgi:hypothetical protein
MESVGGTGGTSAVCDNQPHIITDVTRPYAIALDANYVYFTSRQRNGSIGRVPVRGGPVESLAQGELYPHELAVSNGKMFWVTLGTHAGHLIQAAVTGAERQEIATGDPPGIFGLNADAKNVYHTTFYNVLYSVPIGGGTPVQLSGGPFNSAIVDVKLSANQLYWTNWGNAFFEPPQPQTASVESVDTSGNYAATPLVTQLNCPQFELAVDADHVFWNDAANIYRTSLLGGAYDTVTALQVDQEPDVSPVVAMVSDGTSLYYADKHSVYRVPALGGAPEVVTSGWQTISRIAVDAVSLYFTDNTGNAVVQVAKCATNAAASAPPNSDAGAPSADSGTSDSNPVSASGGDAGYTGVHGCIDPTVIANVLHPYGLALDDQYLYFSQFDQEGAVMRSPLAGGPPEPIETSEVYPHDIAVVGNRVLWCLHDGNDGHLIADLKTGGDRQLFATGYGDVSRVTSDDTFVYYISSYNSPYRVAIGGGDASLVAGGPYNSSAQDLAVFDGELYWPNGGVWADTTHKTTLPNTGFVAKASVAGSADLGRTTLVPSLSYPLYRIAVDGANVYFIDDQYVYRTSHSEGTVQRLAPIAPASGPIVDLELDRDFVYFADVHGVYRVPLAGGAVVPLSTGWGHVVSIAVNATNVFFTDYAGGAVLQLTK